MTLILIFYEINLLNNHIEKSLENKDSLFKMTKIKKEHKKAVHATISDDSYTILEKYEQEFGSKSAVVDASIKSFEKLRQPYLHENKKIWCRAREELNMVLVGKTTLLSYITGKKEEVFTANIAIESIEWYLGKRKEEMHLEEFLVGLKGMWLVANYFYNIEFEKSEKGVFQMKFNHDLTKNYSRFWAEYFENLLINEWNCSIDKFIRNESFYLIIKEKK